jgi:hypothetical protein
LSEIRPKSGHQTSGHQAQHQSAVIGRRHRAHELSTERLLRSSVWFQPTLANLIDLIARPPETP